MFLLRKKKKLSEIKAEKMAWQLRALAALAKYLVSVSTSTWWAIITYSSSSWWINALFWPSWVLQACSTLTNMPEKH